MREYYGFNPNLPEQHQATDELLPPLRIFQPELQSDLGLGRRWADHDDGSDLAGRPPHRPAERTVPSGNGAAAAKPAAASTTPKRAALVGATLFVAALLVYIGRGYIPWPAEGVEPAELTAPADRRRHDRGDPADRHAAE